MKQRGQRSNSEDDPAVIYAGLDACDLRPGLVTGN